MFDQIFSNLIFQLYYSIMIDRPTTFHNEENACQCGMSALFSKEKLETREKRKNRDFLGTRILEFLVMVVAQADFRIGLSN